MPETLMYSQLERLVGLHQYAGNDHFPASLTVTSDMGCHGFAAGWLATCRASDLCMMLAAALETALIDSGSDCRTVVPVGQHVTHQRSVPGSLPVASNETDTQDLISICTSYGVNTRYAGLTAVAKEDRHLQL